MKYALGILRYHFVMIEIKDNTHLNVVFFFTFPLCAGAFCLKNLPYTLFYWEKFYIIGVYNQNEVDTMRFSLKKLNTVTLPEGLDRDEFLALLPALCEADTAPCACVAELLAPALARIAPEPEEGWLSAAYQMLTDGLFADPAYRRPADPVSMALRLLVETLDILFACEEADFDPLTHLLPFDSVLCESSRVREEYALFEAAIAQCHLITTLRLSREMMPFDSASHTIGVRNQAVHTALMAHAAGLTVDVPLVAAAALCHDIGKFACRGDDAKRIPYLHYYYTWQWLTERGMEHIAHVSANHSTWDLEFENLPIESLLLIYADFRVRGTWQGGRETIRIYSLDDAYEMIMSKLADMTPAKQKRYRLVYCKLRDFERFLRDRGVGSEMSDEAPGKPVQQDISLLSAPDALNALRDMTFESNIRLMHTISTDASFDQLLEQARGEKNTHRIRTYLQLFAEYNTYMSRSNKQKLLSFLYELLMHHEGDVRRDAASIMGSVLANSGPKYRKELPAGAPKTAMAPTMMALLDESVALWESYIDLCLNPDHKIAQKHAYRISNCLKAICESLFASCEEQLGVALVQPLVNRLAGLPDQKAFALIDALSHVPPCYITPELFAVLRPRLLELSTCREPHWQLISLQCIRHLREQADAELIQAACTAPTDSHAVQYLQTSLLQQEQPPLGDQETAVIYLSNLKNAVHWTVKNTQIDMLCTDLAHHPEHAFHTAMHLSNILSVSEHLPVREHAGQALLSVAHILTVDQRNEITVDLMRELEGGQEQISRFIPDYIGPLVCTLPEKEIWESVDFLETLLRGSSQQPAGLALRALGALIAALPASETEIIDYCLGLLLVGVAHYHASIHQSALSVLCHNVIANEALPRSLRTDCFVRTCKKLLSLLAEPSQGQLTFFNRAAMLNHLYRFIVHLEVDSGALNFPAQKPVAFFPGTYDPFSAGHKAIVREIRSRGFEIYLAIDEFSWSKHTLPKLLRRKIVQMSIADQWDTYVFPDDIPINIAFPADLQTLRELFPGRQVCLVAGSDVIRNASAYRSEEPGSAPWMDHIIINRPAAEEAGLPPVRTLLRGQVVDFSLPNQLENISSTRIRDYIDKALDVTALVDPIVQSYIYEYGLYLRSPMLKRMMTLEERCFRAVESTENLPPELFEFISHTAMPAAVALYTHNSDKPVGWACGHTVSVSDLYEDLQDVEACSAVRRYTSGKLLMIDIVRGAGADVHRLLNELLVRSLAGDHTYALCHYDSGDPSVQAALEELGFVHIEHTEDLYCVDMRAPMVLIQDVALSVKEPHRSSPLVSEAIATARPRLRRALTALYPGKLLLCFDAEMLNQSLMLKVQQHNMREGMTGRLGKLMCVPYGKILADSVVPNTVMKTLHVDKSFAPDGSSFSIVEYPGYSPLPNQVRTIKAFRRPAILVDDLLHKGYRIDKLNPIFEQEGLEISKIVVAILSGRGLDLMRKQQRQVDCEYFIPNLHYWVTESLLYPFIGGDSVSGRVLAGRMLPSVNLIIPYYYPRHFEGTTDEALRDLSKTALENAYALLRALETVHQQNFSTALVLRRLGEALEHPRLPDRGSCLAYDYTRTASAYLEDDLLQWDRLRARGGIIHGA